MMKLNSFTVLEVVVSMLLAGIITAFSYASLQFYLRLFSDYHRSLQIKNDLAIFTKALISDFDASTYVKPDADGITCFFPDQKVTYREENDYIIRASTTHDTFSLSTAELKLSFNSKAVSSPHEYVDHFSWTVLINGEQAILERSKKYASDFYYIYKWQ